MKSILLATSRLCQLLWANFIWVSSEGVHQVSQIPPIRVVMLLSVTRYNLNMRTYWMTLLLTLAAMACAGGGRPPVSYRLFHKLPLPLNLATSPTATANPALTPTSAPTPQPLEELSVEQAFPDLSFERMLTLTHAGDGSDRLFLILQPGQIMVLPNDEDVESASTFLDIEDQVYDEGNEEGLLGLAFDPDYSSNGYFYVYYTASDPRRSVISRFSVSEDDPDEADPDSERIILEVPQPFRNHNAGQMEFGPDGYLYIALGDGGDRGDPLDNGQDLTDLLGSILRIDVSTLDSTGTYSIPPDNPFVGQEDARPEIWAYGLRNPLRMSFDPLTGDLWVGDPGQSRFEEVDLIKPGHNYGWNIMEGYECFEPPEDCDRTGLELPVHIYPTDEDSEENGCTIIGGYVYRGSRIPSLYGAYVFGDYCSGKIWALRYNGQEVTEHLEIADTDLSISSFGVDQSGELYILSFDEEIYRFDPD
jgi:glucose/arabinose dehydrogenase